MKKVYLICGDHCTKLYSKEIDELYNSLSTYGIEMCRCRPTRYPLDCDKDDCIFINGTGHNNITHQLELYGFKVLNSSKFMDMCGNKFLGYSFAKSLGLLIPRSTPSGSNNKYLLKNAYCDEHRVSSVASYNSDFINQEYIEGAKSLKVLIIDNKIMKVTGNAKYSVAQLDRLLHNVHIDFGIVHFLVDKSGVEYFNKFELGLFKPDCVDFYNVFAQHLSKLIDN